MDSLMKNVQINDETQHAKYDCALASERNIKGTLSIR